ncbi:putative ATP-dependent RNA helicase TDRD12 isoform X2 [Betta splendens]|uniref:RNA helicase n=1 Tax=Betta splendens TaxID=158456 RepID=A0A6P7MRW9_BETSP|nr:putative ATP-dependent RNA helicase TDRD12 isoform X2 [Betta splendens]
MLKISIVKVESPSCLWGCLTGSQREDSTEQHNKLLAEMNLFYQDVTADPHKLKPSTIEEGEVCVVYWSVKKLWCRAVVDTVITEPPCKVCCLLVDHGERLVVSLNQIRLVAEKFLQLPFLVRRFHLARVQPLTLRVFICEEKAEFIPSTQWDTAATLYLHRLLQASTQTEAVLLESESESTSIELYLTVGTVMICVNDDLVAKSFAYYSSQSVDVTKRNAVEPFSHTSASILTESLPTMSYKQTTPTETPPVMSSGHAAVESVKCGAAGFLGNSQVEDLADEETSESAESGSGEAEETQRTEEKQACSRLLEWLNPGPLHTEPDSADETIVCDDPRKSGILVHSALPLAPCSSLDDAPITQELRQVLRRNSALSPAERYSWPAVARGCNTVVISHTADQPLSYLAPLLTHILLNSISCSVKSSTGPVAVLLCPGWEKAQLVCDLLEEYKVAQILNPIIVLLGVGKEEAKNVRISKSCLLLVTTPYSLVRLLSCYCFLFLRLYHLVLDEADQLFSLAPDQMETILQHFQKVTSQEESASCPQQIVVVAKQWVSRMEALLANHMPYPHIVMTVPNEAALYGNVQQIILMALESSKMSVLLGALDLTPEVGQKTLIVANSAQEVDDVYKAVSNKSAFCLRTHEGLTQQLDFVIQQWRKDISPGTHVVLVTTSDCLDCLGIRDATCVIHFSFPTSPKQFGRRLFCMTETFRNLSERVSCQGPVESGPPHGKSVLLISERNARHVVGVLRYLGRSTARLPPELVSFAQGIHVAREAQKTNKPLCSYLKSFGVCRDSSLCPDRHTFISQLDQSPLPASGVIEVVPLYIKAASVFYGRIIRKDDVFDSLVSEMASYYDQKKPTAKEMLEGGLYAVHEGDAFHRVKILSLPDRRDHLFYSVLVHFIDAGMEEMVKSHQILHLPEQFHSLPGQAVEIIVCQVKPADAEINWHPKATRTISQKIRGLQHRARAVLSLGNTVFVDPMVRVSQVPGLKTVINEHNVQSEILKTGLGVSNPEHVDFLRALCQGGRSNSSKVATDGCGSGDGPEFSIKGEEEELAKSFRTAEVRLTAPHELRPRKSLIPESPEPRLHLKAEPDVQNTREINVTDVCSVTASLKPSQNGEDPITSCQVIESTNGTSNGNATRSFHPQVRWYQTSNAVFATVKLTNPEKQRCDFYPDRVVYRGSVKGRSYRADLDLQSNIAADHCFLEMKSNEPVLKLVKQKQGNWEKLVRNKNVFVSYDMEHFEDDEDRALGGQCFLEDTGDDNWYTNSESNSDSD